MECELRGEYKPDPHGRVIHMWHVVAFGADQGLCGHGISSNADALPVSDLDELTSEERCRPCWQAFHAL
ncbi:hypothetical protein [Streptacidiphilus carbonis]|jgi:hypothetical protein|uniref:hypothetical protein n=1 Tax=Streptacidiphilus carbonis TaxID=105422 RepID=UPI0005A79F1A|nr:hypothetical protein [Streptacidiphilus carbonis]